MYILKEYIAKLFIIAFVVDVLILGVMIFQIVSGIDTPHIPFWDAQIKFLFRGV